MPYANFFLFALPKPIFRNESNDLLRAKVNYTKVSNCIKVSSIGEEKIVTDALQRHKRLAGQMNSKILSQ